MSWKADDRDYSDTWDHGHYVVVIGFDSDHLYFMDPSTLGTYTYMTKADFSNRWHDIDQNHAKAIGLAIYIKNPGGFSITKVDDISYLE